MSRDFIKDALLGVAVGDAIGVPVEFISRESLANSPLTEMIGYGSHHQPPGTWSDDSSLTFCLAEMLCDGYDLNNLARRFINWKEHGYWTPHGRVFDIGIATSRAIYNLEKEISPILGGGYEEDSNGNGSLMRILPLLFLINDWPIRRRYETVREVSSLTHRHIRSVIACFIYLEIALEMLSGKEKQYAYRVACNRVRNFLVENEIANEKEQQLFARCLSGDIFELKEEEVYSSGYVLHTLEASLWCLLNTSTYAEAVLKAANLGEDTDTTAAVTGGLAGLLYGWQTIPEDWLAVLARRADIEQLAIRLSKKLK